jgi:hypothetical protein
MKRRRLLVAISSLALVSAISLTIYLWPRKEPVWNGKTCSQWFAEFRRAKVRYQRTSVYFVHVPTSTPGYLRLQATTNYFDDTEALLRDSAADALRAMGTNIIPVLCREIRRGDPKWLPSYSKFFYKVPRSLQRFVPNPPKSRDEIRGDAALALTLQRAEAAPAWPALFDAFLEAPTPYLRFRLGDTLRNIPVDPVVLDAGLDSLVRHGELSEAVQMIGQFGAWRINSLRILTNAILSTNIVAREAALSQLRYHRHFAPFVLPALRTALTNGNSSYPFCISAADVLESYEGDASEALPELVIVLKSSDRELRYHATRAIESLGTNALPAFPALLDARSDTNEMVQRVVTRTLNKVSPVPTGQSYPDGAIQRTQGTRRILTTEPKVGVPTR